VDIEFEAVDINFRAVDIKIGKTEEVENNAWQRLGDQLKHDTRHIYGTRIYRPNHAGAAAKNANHGRLAEIEPAGLIFIKTAPKS
jgi:hypothetical protein